MSRNRKVEGPGGREMHVENIDLQLSKQLAKPPLLERRVCDERRGSAQASSGNVNRAQIETHGRQPQSALAPLRRVGLAGQHEKGAMSAFAQMESDMIHHAAHAAEVVPRDDKQDVHLVPEDGEGAAHTATRATSSARWKLPVSQPMIETAFGRRNRADSRP